MTTIHDVARRAGVSPVTVSRVINGVNNVNSSTRQKVEQAIKELGYVPNLAARSLRSRQTSTLALIVPDITNAFWTTVARGVEDAAQAEGYSVLLGNSDESLEKQNGYLNVVLQQRVDGVIIAPFDSNARNLSPLRDLKTPLVVIDRQVIGWDVDTVRTDSVSGAYALTRHLISIGHQRIAVISGPRATSTAEERVAGYCLALDEAGLPIDPRLIRRGEFRIHSGKALTDALFAEGLNPTGILAANNVMGMGVLESLKNHNKRVPQDMAIVCFDELPDFSRFYPFLTVFVQPAYDMGINAAQLLLSRIAAREPIQPRQVVLPGRLILRYSCGRLLRHPDWGGVFLSSVKDLSESVLVKPLSAERLRAIPKVEGLNFPGLLPSDQETSLERSDVRRLRSALSFQPVDRPPHIEPRVSSKAVLEYVLERSLTYNQAELNSGRQMIEPEDWVEFARRTGLDAVPCEINWQPGASEGADLPGTAGWLRSTYPQPALTEALNRLERFLRAAQGSPVGVYLTFGSFFAAPHVAPSQRSTAPERAAPPDRSAPPAAPLVDQRVLLVRAMDSLLAYQGNVLRAVCDRFASDLVMVLIQDHVLSWSGMTAKIFKEEMLPRLDRLIEPAREHGLRVGLSTQGAVTSMLPALQKAGFSLIYPQEGSGKDFSSVRTRWYGKLALAGGFPTRLLVSSEPGEIEAQVHALCTDCGPKSGFIIGSTGGITDDVRPENFMALVRAVHRARQTNLPA